MNIKKIILRSLMSMLICFALPVAQAQSYVDYPNKPIRIVVAYAPGGSTDIVARLFAQELGNKLGQPVLVENRAGAGTLIGTDLVIKAAPDGYTLFWATPATVITPLLHKKPTYDVLKDLQPVSLATTQSMGVLVSGSIGVNNMNELIQYAKANPGKVNFASSGNGSAQHLAAEALNDAANINMLHIPYKGAGVALNDLVAGRVDVMITSLVGNMMEQVKEGRIKLIATTGPERSSFLNNIPSVSESVPNFGIRTWTALLAPAQTPPVVVAKLNRAMAEIHAEGNIQRKIENQAMDVTVATPSALNSMLARENDFYAAILKRTNTKLD